MPPKSYTYGRISGQPTKITVHYTAGREGYGDVDINEAAWCQIRKDGTSAHYFIDGDSCTQCVRTTDEAHTALEHGNDQGIHYELCGTAQSREQWLDPPSRNTIRLAAKQMARDMQKYGIPLVRLIGRQVRDSAAKGICGHADWTTGWPEDGGTHMDPGTYFPWDVLFADIAAELLTEEDDMDQNSPVTQALDVVIGGIAGGTITRPLRWWLSAPYAHVIELERETDERFAELNTKLDQVIGLLTPKEPV